MKHLALRYLREAIASIESIPDEQFETDQRTCAEYMHLQRQCGDIAYAAKVSAENATFRAKGPREQPAGTLRLTFEKVNTLPDESCPLIYVWRVGADVYVGKSVNGTGRAIREYSNNVRKMLAGEPYRKSKPDGWRRVHRRLHAATVAGEAITLELIGSTHATLLTDERRLIRELGATLNGEA